MIASIKGSRYFRPDLAKIQPEIGHRFLPSHDERDWDVVEGGVDEEDDGEDAENEWGRVSMHRSRQQLYLSSWAETRSTPKQGSKPCEELFKPITGIERTSPDEVVSSSAPVGPHASQPVYVLPDLRHLQTIDQTRNTEPDELAPRHVYDDEEAEDNFVEVRNSILSIFMHGV